MRMLLDTKSKDAQLRPLSANLLLLDNVQARPNSSASYTFGNTPAQYMQGRGSNETLGGPLSTRLRNDRPISATPSMIAGGKRYMLFNANHYDKKVLRTWSLFRWPYRSTQYL